MKVTRDKELHNNILSLSNPALRIYTECLYQLNFANNSDNLFAMTIVEINWESFSVTSRNYKSRIYKELKDIGFWIRVDKDKYHVSIYYINPFSSKQQKQFFDELIVTSKREYFKTLGLQGP